MKLDPKLLKYMTKEQFRVLSAVEQGSKNHHLVPLELIVSIAGLRHGGAHKIINQLLRNKLVARNSQKYEGYRLTYLGYDFLALRVFLARGTITAVGQQIGVGKESDIFLVKKEDGTLYALKLHRLGRVSFKAVKAKRDYLQGRSKGNWLYLSRLAATKEYAFMQALYKNGFKVPTPIDQNRHCVVMELCSGYPLYQVKEMAEPVKIYNEMMSTIVRFARYGLIHCDFNEFNLMVADDSTVTVIDFPQMISTEHENAKSYFDRDVQCIRKFFSKVLKVDVTEYPKWGEYGARTHSLDSEVKASGFSNEAASDFDKLLAAQRDAPEPDASNQTTLADTDTDATGAEAADDDADADSDTAAVDTEAAEGSQAQRSSEADSAACAAPALPAAAAAALPTDAPALPTADDVDASESLLAASVATTSSNSSAQDAVMNRLRAQRIKKSKARQKRTATRNKNKNRAKRELKRSVKAQTRNGGQSYILA